MSGDPAAHAREAFCRQLQDLHGAAGRPSYQVLVQHMHALDPPPTNPPGRSSVGDLLRGHFVRTPPWGRVEAFVRACAAHPGGRVSPRDADLDMWRSRHNRLKAVLETTGPSRIDGRADAPNASFGYPAGMPAGADGEGEPRAGTARCRWDVALSFASEQRGYVEQVAVALKVHGVRCFYDADEQLDLWGKYLAEELLAVYGGQAATVVVFVSADYAERDWTRLERRVALNRAVRERREYVLPARFDDTPLPGLLSDMVAIDLRTRSPQEFAVMVTAKLAALGVRPA